MTLCVAVMAAGSGSALAASPGSTDELRLTAKRAGASTGVVSSEIFNARYPDGQLKPLRHSRIAFPKGTRFDPLATDLCEAEPDDFAAQGMSACPPSTQIGSGNATVVTTGTPIEAGPVPVDVTQFARPDGSILVFSESGTYLSSQVITIHGRFQETSTTPSCVDVTEQPPCEHGEFAPRSLDLKVPKRSRTVDGKRHHLITTPRRCPRKRHWRFADTHTFADGSRDVFVNHPRCRRRR